MRFSSLKLVLCSTILVACGSDGGTTTTSTVETMTLSSSNGPVLTLGTSTLLSARAFDNTGQQIIDAALTWSSSNSAVAAVSNGGNVTGATQGTATITVTAGGKSASLAMTVTPVASITLSNESLDLIPSESRTVTATLLGHDNLPLTEQSVSWTSSAPNVATIDQQGHIQAVASGQTLVQANAGGRNNSLVVRVLIGGPYTTAGGALGNANDLISLVIPAGALSTNTLISILPLADPVATVGFVSGTQYEIRPGSQSLNQAATIAIKFPAPPVVTGGPIASRYRLHRWDGAAWVLVTGSTSNTVTRVVTGQILQFGIYSLVEVPIPVATISMSPNPGLVVVGSIREVTGTPRDSSNGSFNPARLVTWTSSDPTIATATGGVIVGLGTGVNRAQITGISPGTVTITGTSGSASNSVTFTVTALPFDLPLFTTGASHACGLNAISKLYCWGSNTVCQLAKGEPLCDSSGPPSTTPQLSPTSLIFTKIAAGTAHSCGLTASGAAWCWGRNTSGELGGGQAGSSFSTPVAVTGGLSFTAIYPGDRNTCALIASGDAYCWGINTEGEIGDGTFNNQFVPTPVSGGLKFQELSAGSSFTCGRTAAGVIWCWGLGTSGQLGEGHNFNRNIPVMVDDGRSYTAVRVGFDHACALKANGEVYCWGKNDVGQLGIGTAGSDEWSLRKVAGTNNFVQLMAGWRHTCGLLANGAAWCWGQGASLGDGLGVNRSSPGLVVGNHFFTSITSNLSQSTCGRSTLSGIWCWGPGSSGQLGDASTTNRNTPQALLPPQ